MRLDSLIVEAELQQDYGNCGIRHDTVLCRQLD